MTLSSVMFYTGENPYTGEKGLRGTLAGGRNAVRRGISSGRRSPAHDRRRDGGRQPRKASAATPTQGNATSDAVRPPHGKSRKR